MDRELEIAGAASAGGWLRWRKKHAIEPGTPCANCETPLQGPYCFNCGQLAESFERNVVHLIVEGFESFFAVRAAGRLPVQSEDAGPAHPRGTERTQQEVG
jgi:hypothetical protein